MDENLAHRLRDIRLPEDVSTWPPAPGWWLLALLVPLLIFLLVRLWQRRGHLRSEALEEMRRIEAAYHKDGDTARLAAGLSQLLRRVAIARDGRPAVSGLSGAAWLAYLDRRLGGGTDFSQGPGRVLTSLPYGGPGDAVPVELCDLARRWIGANT